MVVKSYQDLLVWQKSMEVVKNVYDITKKITVSERFGLIDQMKRSAISLPSNIAEGRTRNSKKDFMHFLWIANGSRAELETQLLIAVKVGYLKEKDIKDTMDKLTEIGKMLHTMIRRLGECG